MSKIHMKFHKMHGLGNDFIILDATSNNIILTPSDIRNLSDRHIGIGFDQLLLLKKSVQADIACIIYNSDGSKAVQCGNGMRCVARFLHENKIITKSIITIETDSGVIQARIKDYANISIQMGKPVFGLLKLKPLDLSNDIMHDAYFVSIGNPHIIIFVQELNSPKINTINNSIQQAYKKSNGINVGFLKIIDKNHIALQTFERGSGKTLACGSNACAAVSVGIKLEKINHKTTVSLPKGALIIEWSGESDDSIIMTGPANYVFRGEISNQHNPQD